MRDRRRSFAELDFRCSRAILASASDDPLLASGDYKFRGIRCGGEPKMIYPTRTIEVFSRDSDHCKRLKDPTAATLYHLEAFLPFSEAVKLEKGNANLRPPSEKKKPFQEMIVTVEDDPASFHKKNR